MQLTEPNNMFGVLKRLATYHPTNDKKPVRGNIFLPPQLGYGRTQNYDNYADLHYSRLVLSDLRLKTAFFD